jgi:ribosomal protein S18 acetylase RimI-like enzyme
MQIEIRRVTVDDVEAYREIRLRSVREHPEAFLSSYEEESARTVEQDRERLAAKEGRDDDFVLAAFDEGRPVGLTGAIRSGHHAKRHHVAWIWGVYVAPEVRGRGVGRRLLESAIETISKADGVEMLQLGVGTENHAALALYERMGFETYGTEVHCMKLPDRYIDEHLMVLFLKP